VAATSTPRINRLTQAVRFVRVSRLLLWTIWVIYRERRRVLRARARGDSHVQPNVALLIQVLVAYRKTAVQLGVLMIKLGQFLSSRADLLPQPALDVLSSLQDEVPPAPYEHVRTVIETELGRPVDELFSSLSTTATAAASLGQVHRGVLIGGDEVVAVKVQRPNIRQLVDMDLSTIRFVIWVIGWFVNTRDFIDLPAFYREFRRTILEEIDYVQEADNARRFRTMFEGQSDIFIPRVYDDYVSTRVLVLEWVDGIKVNDYPRLDAAGVSRFAVARRTVEAYFYQFFEVGFFHADPHPGNIFVQPGPTPEEPTVAFVDFGMVGTLTRTSKQGLKNLFLGFVINDPHAMVEALNRLGFIGEGANLAAIEYGVATMMNQYHGITLGEARDLNVSEVAHELEDLFYAQPFRIPAQFAFTGRAIGTLSGLATGLSPDFNLFEIALPYAQEFLGLSPDSASETVQHVLSQVAVASRTLLALPTKVDRVLMRLETGQLEVRVAEDGRNGSGRRRGNHRGTTVAGPDFGGLVLTLASLGAGTVLLVNQLVAPGWFCLGLAAVVVVGSILRR
jgi:predicted unusual protein kinase regulating ubiquinone biosynthesis (AarF/ABC1/UbiB family)